MIRVAVDAMGGDFAPQEVIKGVLLANKEYPIDIILVGDERIIKQELEKQAKTSSIERIFIVHAEEEIKMDDIPSIAARRKRNSSMHVGMKLVRNGEANAFFSAGNTGAMMAVSKLILRTIEGVDRPAIGAVFPNIKSSTIILDVGANVDCKPIHFLQFAIMGKAYARYILKLENPRIGLLSIGEEDVKGNELTKSVFTLLKNSNNFNFIGNVEAKEIFKGVADVIVCDGFTGNIALKSSEAAAGYIGTLLKEELKRTFISKIGALLAKGAFDRVKKRTDYTEYGGAPLLGVDGIVIIGHGSSNANAVKNGIRVSYELALNKVNTHIAEDILNSLENHKQNISLWESIKDKVKNMASQIQK
ncbi:phosphate acyltransferase PlsX [Calditerrivibrio nitroreducens]|uniref:Phosphate acyltransferase n=1 Tax=Calditerrivibrio nitroreducens (strain DSM 19672 / NBRC 101217 / Yu37-1) TaxID=768670 RepID=E4TIZ8_CALNY|nr:phosphate acyltransferase PlsX [Calditerrivibrio nitroreducens]ADR19130.1 phosphate:acyl-(acyl carrier protein) acyltransferase [Calditerrivibrio nitroreducens DSM 19672]